jgi:hypothetical protein
MKKKSQKRKKYRLNKRGKTLVAILIMIPILVIIFNGTKNEVSAKAEEIVLAETQNEIVEVVEEEPIEEEVQEVFYETRMTSYYPGDDCKSGTVTGSGKGVKDFEVNEYGWFTYDGKLVVATATKYLLNYGFTLSEGVHTYKYWDEITIEIDGVRYEAIVLDSCGHAMHSDRIDLFVSNSKSVKDTTIKVIGVE